MADLVVGLAKSVVEGALTKAQSAIEEEAKLRQSAQRDLVFITGEFEMMHSFLHVATSDRVENKVVMTWVRQVRELAYDVEDCIEFVVHLDTKTKWWWRMVPTWCIAPPPAALSLDEAVDEIEQLKARVEDVSTRNSRYNLISDSGNKPVVQHQVVPAMPGGAAALGVTAFNMLTEARDAARRQQGLGDLTRLITKEGDDLQVISVWGTGGDHGTTSIIRKAFNDPEIRKNFGCRAWVKLMHPFDAHEFVQRFMAQVYANSCEEQGVDKGVHVLEKMKASQEDLLKEFVEEVKTKTYLVVLENLTDMVDWDAVRMFLPDMKKGSWIIVSTQQFEIASLCIGHSYQPMELKQFSPDHSVCAFFKQGSQEYGDQVWPWAARRSGGAGRGLDENRNLVVVGPGRPGFVGLGPGSGRAQARWPGRARLGPEFSRSGFFRPGPARLLARYDGDKDDKLALLHVGQNSSAGNTTSSNRKAEARYWMNNYPLVGRETEMNELRNYTAKARFSNSRVISVWGIAGIGKSALVRNLYHDRVLHSEQFNEYRWVDVSHPFNLRDFSRSLLSDDDSEKDPIKECRELLSSNRCLVIIDDLQSKEEWDSIQAALISQSSASIIIVITTEANVATYCANNEEQVFNVKGLEVVAAIGLFRNEVHRKEPLSILNHHVNLELDELILKCGGLPKVIVALAALLATQTVTMMDNVRSLNRRFMHHLETNLEYSSLRSLFSWMYAYFRDCPDSLKPCIFYLSIFPRDCNIRRRRLVRRWIAEGYSRDSDEKSAEEQGEDFFSKLLELSIIQKIHRLGTTAFNEARMVSCQVNGFIREYIISRRMEENLVFELGPNCVLTTQRTGRHLIILRDWDRDKIVFESIDFSRLRSMTVFGNWEPFFISKSMRLIRVLDLEDALGLKDEDVEKIVKKLCRLKFLSLRRCSQIHHLPSSLGDLRQLQSLDIRHTSIVTLPVNIGKLEKLQYIRAGAMVSTPPASSSRFPNFHGCRRLVGVQVPREIGKLTALHTVGVVNISASGREAIKGLKKLTQLRKLGVSGINKNNCKDFLDATSGHVHLQSLLVRLDKDNQGCLNKISLPWKNLQSVKLYGLHDKLPLSTSHLEKLRKLDLEMATLGQSDIEFLAQLPKLCILRLRLNQPQVDNLHFDAELCGEQLDTFENVKILEIACSYREVFQVVFGSKSMKNLELLKVDCFTASYRLIGLNYLSELKQVLLKGADENIKTAFVELLAYHPRTPPPAVKLEELPPLAGTWH